MMKPKEAISLNHRKDYTTDERTGILYKRIGDYYFPVGNRFGIVDDGDEEIEQMLRAAPNNAGPSAFLGRFAQAHRKYLKESRKSLYASLRASGRLGSCLADLDRQAKEMHDRLCAQMALQEGVTEQLKAADQLEWLRRMEKMLPRSYQLWGSIFCDSNY